MPARSNGCARVLEAAQPCPGPRRLMSTKVCRRGSRCEPEQLRRAVRGVAPPARTWPSRIARIGSAAFSVGADPALERDTRSPATPVRRAASR